MPIEERIMLIVEEGSNKKGCPGENSLLFK